MNILSINNLNKSFGDKKVIDNMTLNVPEGCIYGFLGANGAGKTTTMKMILGLIKKDSGEIKICGETVSFGQNKTNQYVGYLPDVPAFYKYMRPMEYLKLCGELTSLDSKTIKERSEELLSLVGLGKEDKKIGSFSRGMKQRLGIAQALINQPKLLICDEPTSALDPIGRKEILDILVSVKGKTTIVFSTHILSDVEKICDHVSVLNNGKIVLDGTLADLKKQNGRHDVLEISFISQGDMISFFNNKRILSIQNQITSKDNTLVITSNKLNEIQKTIYDVFISTGIFPTKIEVLEPTMESLFMEVVK
ncbi:MAG: ABC transporter ATP-binding protein [Clostridiales bacterium]|nr:ABC transporter ATP-binding protein [Clostridiales bacterium]